VTRWTKAELELLAAAIICPSEVSEEVP
jgi:hypothetical protein